MPPLLYPAGLGTPVWALLLHTIHGKYRCAALIVSSHFPIQVVSGLPLVLFYGLSPTTYIYLVCWYHHKVKLSTATLDNGLFT